MKILYGYDIPIMVMSEIARREDIVQRCHASVIDDHISVVVDLDELDKEVLVETVKSYFNDVATSNNFDLPEYLDDKRLDHTVRYYQVANDGWNKYMSYTFRFMNNEIIHVFGWKERVV